MANFFHEAFKLTEEIVVTCAAVAALVFATAAPFIALVYISEYFK